MNPVRDEVVLPDEGAVVAPVADESQLYVEVEPAVDEEADAAADDGWAGEGHA